MKIKPKSVLLNVPVALMFDAKEEIGVFAATINTLLVGKVRLKSEELGKLGEQYVGLFYLQRNEEYQHLYDRFVELIEQQVSSVEYKEVEETEEGETVIRHILCVDDCDDYGMLHLKGLDHCECGGEWAFGHCLEELTKEDNQ